MHKNRDNTQPLSKICNCTQLPFGKNKSKELSKPSALPIRALDFYFWLSFLVASLIIKMAEYYQKIKSFII